MNPLSRILNSLTNRKKQETMFYLQGMPESQLIHYGFSPALVRQGVSAWPWRVDDKPEELLAIELAIARERRHVNELHNYTDAELADLGLSRGYIRHAVRHGRPGIDNISTQEAA